MNVASSVATKGLPATRAPQQDGRAAVGTELVNLAKILSPQITGHPILRINDAHVDNVATPAHSPGEWRWAWTRAIGRAVHEGEGIRSTDCLAVLSRASFLPPSYRSEGYECPTPASLLSPPPAPTASSSSCS